MMNIDSDDLLALALKPEDRKYLIQAIARHMRRKLGAEVPAKTIKILVDSLVIELEAGRGRGMTRIAAVKLLGDWLGMNDRPVWAERPERSGLPLVRMVRVVPSPGLPAPQIPQSQVNAS